MTCHTFTHLCTISYKKQSQIISILLRFFLKCRQKMKHRSRKMRFSAVKSRILSGASKQSIFVSLVFLLKQKTYNILIIIKRLTFRFFSLSRYGKWQSSPLTHENDF